MSGAADLVSEWADALRREEFDAARLKELRHAWSDVVISFTEADRIAIEKSTGLTPEAIGRMLDECDSPTDIARTARELAASSRGCACSGEGPPEPEPADIEEAAALLIGRAVVPALWAVSLRFGSSASRA